MERKVEFKKNEDSSIVLVDNYGNEIEPIPLVSSIEKDVVVGVFLHGDKIFCRQEDLSTVLFEFEESGKFPYYHVYDAGVEIVVIYPFLSKESFELWEILSMLE